jgi:hypothetical protein
VALTVDARANIYGYCRIGRFRRPQGSHLPKAGGGSASGPPRGAGPVALQESPVGVVDQTMQACRSLASSKPGLI